MNSILNNTLMYEECVIIPILLQKRILKEFHVGHPVIARMKSLMTIYDNWINKLTLVEGDPKAPFSIATTQRGRVG